VGQSPVTGVQAVRKRNMLTIPLVVPERMLQWAAQRGFIEFEYEGVADNRVPVAVV